MVTSGCPPGDLYDPHEAERRRIAEFWSQLRVCDELDATTWRALEPIERQVTECLDQRHRDVARAASLTALAMLIIARSSNN